MNHGSWIMAAAGKYFLAWVIMIYEKSFGQSVRPLCKVPQRRELPHMVVERLRDSCVILTLIMLRRVHIQLMIIVYKVLKIIDYLAIIFRSIIPDNMLFSGNYIPRPSDVSASTAARAPPPLPCRRRRARS